MDRRDLWIQAAQNVQPQVHELIEAEFKKLVASETPLNDQLHAAAETEAVRFFTVMHNKPMFNDCITCIKQLRAMFGFGLKEAKDITDAARKTVWGF